MLQQTVIFVYEIQAMKKNTFDLLKPMIMSWAQDVFELSIQGLKSKIEYLTVRTEMDHCIISEGLIKIYIYMNH